MSAIRSWSAGELANTGFMKRGVPTTPSLIEPPRKGTLTMKELFMFCSMARVLTKKTSTRVAKTTHSFLEKCERTLFISDLLGNFQKLRMRPKKFSIKEMFNAKYF